jgi:hypothetical protein
MHSNVDLMVVDGNNWREIDHELRSIAKRQRALDAERSGAAMRGGAATDLATVRLRDNARVP